MNEVNNAIKISLPIRDQIADILRRDIISGKLEQGARLSEREISRQYNISTSPVKEAIRILNSEGLVRTLPRKGSFVANIEEDNVTQMIHVRSVIEGVGAYWGTIHITDEDIALMDDYLNQFHNLLETGDLENREVIDRIAQLNYHFHLLLSDAAHNEYLNQLIKTLGSFNNTLRYLYYLSDEKSDYPQSYADHKQILEAVKARNPQLAEELTVKHIRRTGGMTLKMNNASPHST